jgi:hypothetical protein
MDETENQSAESEAVDKRGVLDEEVFSYRASNDKVFLFWQGKQVMILKGQQAQKFLARIDGLEGKAAQLAMAKITGNFKHGNERTAKDVNRQP